MSVLILLLAQIIGTVTVSSPHTLRTELIEDTHTVYSGGRPTSASLDQVTEAWNRGDSTTFQVATISSPHPGFGWKLPDQIGQQAAYRILVASSPHLLHEGKADLWDSGDTASDISSGIKFCGDSLKPSTIYYWTVRVTGSDGAISAYSRPQQFLTSPRWNDEYPRIPLQKTLQTPVHTVTDSNRTFADFGKAAFGQLSLTVSADSPDTLIVRLGETAIGNRVDLHPGASIRATSYRLPVKTGNDTYLITFRPDGRNARIKPHGEPERAVLMPGYIGEVYPFRYCEIESSSDSRVCITGVHRNMVHYAWNDNASYFHSSDSTLNAVWELCRYTIPATSYTGVYIDGDRERIAYEADALVNQLSHYCVDEEYSMGRYSVDYLLDNATWPTEWILQGVLLAWNDYLYTGDTSLLKKNYSRLKTRTLLDLKDDNGLISTRTGRQSATLLRDCGYYGESIRDIVDWPQKGALGIGLDKPGEADGYELTDYNTVVNAYHFKALSLMAIIAQTLGKTSEADFFATEAKRVKDTVNRLLFDKQRKCYRDGIGTDHCSLHASMYPMCFGMVPEKYMDDVMRHIKSRGMACSTYGAQFLLEAVYNGGSGDYALQLLTDKGKRSWWNMIESGSTMTWEAWDREFKPNLDWNHAWGASPANIIPRKLMGIEPTEPGWRQMRIKPQPGSLQSAEIRVPTIKGTVDLSFIQGDSTFKMDVRIPAGTISEICIPTDSRRYRLSVNDQPQESSWHNGFANFTLPSGTYSITLIER